MSYEQLLIKSGERWKLINEWTPQWPKIITSALDDTGMCWSTLGSVVNFPHFNYVKTKHTFSIFRKQEHSALCSIYGSCKRRYRWLSMIIKCITTNRLVATFANAPLRLMMWWHLLISCQSSIATINKEISNIMARTTDCKITNHQGDDFSWMLISLELSALMAHDHEVISRAVFREGEIKILSMKDNALGLSLRIVLYAARATWNKRRCIQTSVAKGFCFLGKMLLKWFTNNVPS